METVAKPASSDMPAGQSVLELVGDFAPEAGETGEAAPEAAPTAPTAPTTIENAKRVWGMIGEHRQKDFVDRIVDPNNAPTLDNGDGTISTHSMATMEADGKHYVFPTVQRVSDGRVHRFEVEEAFKRAFDAGEVIGFDNADDANWLAENYKELWKGAKQRKR